MPGIIPSPKTKVDSAQKSDFLIDNYDFLMMCSILDQVCGVSEHLDVLFSAAFLKILLCVAGIYGQGYFHFLIDYDEDFHIIFISFLFQKPIKPAFLMLISGPQKISLRRDSPSSNKDLLLRFRDGIENMLVILLSIN